VSPPPSPSFRDPAGFCFACEGRILRVVRPAAIGEHESAFNTPAVAALLADGRLIGGRRLPSSDLARLAESPGFRDNTAGREIGAVIEHEPVPFPSHAAEWPVEMLSTAASLTLDLARSTLDAGFSLKDATPANVMFKGTKPVFLDWLSFERRAPGDAVWAPYGQFVRTFLLPLLAHRTWGLRPADTLAGRRDGLEPEEVHRWCGPVRRWLPPMLTLVTLPVLLGRRRTESIATMQTKAGHGDPARARYILDSMFARLGRTLRSLRPRAITRSVWSDYEQRHPHSEAARAAKERFVRTVLEECRPVAVLDVGANTGRFSRMAAQAGARVVAVDTDEACAGANWRESTAAGLDVLPLVVDLACPTPATGWRNRESPSFLDRAAGGFDLVLMLAVLHHLLVADRVPLAEVLELAASLTRRWLLIEFVPPEDELFAALARGREALHAGLNTATFEAACHRRFVIARSAELPGTARRLYLLEKRHE
jgi:SAM-dependent methyltransferase